jgi:hypothetical protein
VARKGGIKGAPPDAAENHDTYLYGGPEEIDKDHVRAVEAFQELEGRNLPDVLVTTDHVVFETRSRLPPSSSASTCRMGGRRLGWSYSRPIGSAS